MRYLLINDMYIAGGAEVQSKREFEQFTRKGWDAKYITFDLNYGYGESLQPNHLNLASTDAFPLSSIRNRYFFNRKLYKELRRMIDDFKPDFIHLNNVYLMAPTVYKAVENYYCIQTVRDFSIVCIKSTCVLPDCAICPGIIHGSSKCFTKCFPKSPKQISVFLGRWLALKQNETRKKFSVNQFVCPSQCLTDYCNRHGYPTICINNPFDFSITQHFQKAPCDKKIFLYYGVVSEKKGVLKLVEAFEHFSKTKADAELHIAGKLDGISKEQLERTPKIKYLGFMKYNAIIEKLKNVYSVVVPSVWVENYPNTVLEGFATKCIVVGSNRGGIPEQIGETERLFDVMSQQDIVRCLDKTYALTPIECEKIYERQLKYLTQHNTQEVYYEKMLALVEENINAQKSVT